MILPLYPTIRTSDNSALEEYGEKRYTTRIVFIKPMRKVIEIAENGATPEQLDEVTDAFVSLRVSRDRQPTLVFESDNQPLETYQRTSNGVWLFGSVPVKDRDTLRDCLQTLLTRRGRVTIGLVEGSSTREY